MSKVYEYISAEVQEYWMLVEDALNDAVRYQPNPDAEMLKNAISTETVYYNELKLLYVAVTRSRYGLYMSYSGNLTPLFPIGTKTVDMKRL